MLRPTASFFPIVDIAGKETLQLIKIGIRQSGHLQRGGIVVPAHSLRSYVDLIGKGESRSERIEGRVAPLLPSPAYQREQRVLVEQGLVSHYHVPLYLLREIVEPAILRAPHLHPIVKSNREELS